MTEPAAAPNAASSMPAFHGQNAWRSSPLTPTRPSTRPSFANWPAAAWVKAGHPLCLIGDSGTGKTHLLIALRTLAAEAGYRVRYTLASRLVNELVEAADDKQLTKLMNLLAAVRLYADSHLEAAGDRSRHARGFRGRSAGRLRGHRLARDSRTNSARRASTTLENRSRQSRQHSAPRSRVRIRTARRVSSSEDRFPRRSSDWSQSRHPV